MEEQIHSCKTPGSGSDGPLDELAPTSRCCCKCSNDSENTEVAGTEVDFINQSAEMEEQVLHVDANPNDPRSFW